MLPPSTKNGGRSLWGIDVLVGEWGAITGANMAVNTNRANITTGTMKVTCIMIRALRALRSSLSPLATFASSSLVRP